MDKTCKRCGKPLDRSGRLCKECVWNSLLSSKYKKIIELKALTKEFKDRKDLKKKIWKETKNKVLEEMYGRKKK